MRLVGLKIQTPAAEVPSAAAAGLEEPQREGDPESELSSEETSAPPVPQAAEPLVAAGEPWSATHELEAPPTLVAPATTLVQPTGAEPVDPSGSAAEAESATPAADPKLVAS